MKTRDNRLAAARVAEAVTWKEKAHSGGEIRSTQLWMPGVMYKEATAAGTPTGVENWIG